MIDCNTSVERSAEGLGKVWHKVFDDSDDDDDALTNVEVYKPDKFGHQVAKKTHERVMGNTKREQKRKGNST